MKKEVLKIVLYIYFKLNKSYSIRILIKKIIGNGKVGLIFNGFYINVGTKSSIENALLFNEYNEVTVLKIIKYYTSLGYNFIDIGANIGIHSLTAAHSNARIEIFSFEPEPTNYQDLIKNISVNNFLNVRPFKIGLGNYCGNNLMNINEGRNKGKHSLKVDFKEFGTKINIPLTQLDRFVENIDGDCLLIKIDVEGFEKEVILGAKQVIDKTKNSVLIIELLIETNGDENCKEIVILLKKYGFEKIFKIDEQDELVTVFDFEGSADYIFFKGINNALKI